MVNNKKKMNRESLEQKIAGGVPEISQKIIKKQLIKLIRENEILQVNIDNHLKRGYDDWHITFRTMTIDFGDK